MKRVWTSWGPRLNRRTRKQNELDSTICFSTLAKLDAPTNWLVWVSVTFDANA